MNGIFIQNEDHKIRGLKQKLNITCADLIKTHGPTFCSCALTKESENSGKGTYLKVRVMYVQIQVF